MKALVTGGSGLIGANLVRELLAAGHEVRALVRPSSNTAALRSLPVELAAGDVRDMDAFRAAQGSFSDELAAAAERAGMIPSTVVVYIRK